MPEPSIKTLLSLPRTRLLKIQSEEWPDRRNITFRRRITRFILCDLPHHRYPWRCRPSFQVAADGHYFAIYDDGHHRQLPRLTSGPFKYKTYSYENFKKSAPYAEGTGHAMKSAVITPSMLYLLYPLNGNVEGYSKEQFIKDLVNECEKDIRGCFEAGAKRVSIDFTEGRLASKKDSRNPWTCAHLLKTFVDLNNKLLYRFSAEERANIGIHTCPGGDCDSVHSGEVPYAALLPSFFAMNAGSAKVFDEYANGVKQVAFIGVTNPLNPKVETADEVAADILEASKYTAKDQLGATDDCGFSPFSIDVKPKHGSPYFARDIAMQKIMARVDGARMASEKLGV